VCEHIIIDHCRNFAALEGVEMIYFVRGWSVIPAPDGDGEY